MTLISACDLLYINNAILRGKLTEVYVGNKKIRVNSVAPGAIETDFGGGFVRDNADFNQHWSSETALGRVGLPDDIGTVVAFLCSDDSKWINAQRIEVSGGFKI